MYDVVIFTQFLSYNAYGAIDRAHYEKLCDCPSGTRQIHRLLISIVSNSLSVTCLICIGHCHKETRGNPLLSTGSCIYIYIVASLTGSYTDTEFPLLGENANTRLVYVI